MRLYFATGSGIQMLQHGATWPAPLASTAGANFIATDGTYLYWTDTASKAIGRVAIP